MPELSFDFLFTVEGWIAMAALIAMEVLSLIHI